MIYADALCILLSCAGPYFFYFLSFIQEPMDESMPSIVGYCLLELSNKPSVLLFSVPHNFELECQLRYTFVTYMYM